jgi:hypothetical protein
MTAISWKTGATDVWSDSAAWSTGVVPGSSDDVTITVAPQTALVPYTVEVQSAVSVHSVTLNQAAATLQVSNTTLSVGTTFALTAGAIDLYNGTLQGGTYVSAAGTVLLDQTANAINNVTWDGTLDLTAGLNGDQVTLNTLTMHGANGTGAGTLAIGASVKATVYDGTLSNAVVTLGNNAFLYNDGGSLTLASTTSVTASTSATLGFYSYEPFGVVLNQGKITASGTASALSISAGTFTNTGSIIATAGGKILINTSTGTNSGLISVGSGSFVELETSSSAGFTNTGSIAVTGTLALGYALTTAQLSAFPTSAGTLAIAGALSNVATTLTTSTKLANLMLDGGTITGGTVVNNGHFAFGSTSVGSYASNAGTLAGVTFDGAINLTAPLDLTVTGSLTLQGSTGSGAGSLVVTGAGAGIDFIGSQVLNNAAVKLGSNTFTPGLAYLEAGNYGETSGTTLVLGTSLAVTQAGTYAVLFSNGSGDAILNDGSITAAVAGGTLTLQGFTNAGTLNDTNELLSLTGTAGIASGLTNSGTLSLAGTLAGIVSQYYLAAPMFSNAGLLSVSNGASITLGSTLAFTNTGTLSISAATVSLYGSYTTASLGSVKVTNAGTLGILGTLTNTGTLALGAGNAISALALGGLISGGTIKDSGGGLKLAGGTLSGVAFDGTLSLATANTRLTVLGGLVMAGATGSGAGSIALTGGGSNIDFIGSQTLDNATVSLGGTASTGYAQQITAGYYNESAATTLTLGAHVLLSQSGTYATLGGYTTNDVIINNGTITAAYTSGFFNAGGLINNGTILVANGDDVSAIGGNAGTITVSGGTLSMAGTFANSGLLSLSGTASQLFANYGTALANSGTLSVGGGAILSLGSSSGIFSNTGTLLVAAASVSLGGSFTTASFGTVKVTNGGSLSLYGTLANSGTFSLGTGSAIPVLTLGYGGTISGGAIADAGGGLVAAGGTLSNVSYKGLLSLAAANATLTVAGGLAMQPATGTGVGTIAVTGAASSLYLAGSQTIGNAVLDIGASTAGTYASIYLTKPTSSVATVTLAAGSSLVQTGNAILYGSSGFNSSAGSYVSDGDTLLNNGTLSFNQANAFFNTRNANIQNAGAMSIGNGADISIADGTLTNSGTISLSGSLSTLSFDTTDGNNDGFVNTGLLSIGAGNTVTLDGSTNFYGTPIAALQWSNAGTINVAGGTLYAGNAFTTAQLGRVAVSNGGSLVFDPDAVLNNAGATLSLGTGSAIGTLMLGGTISGGTIADAGGGINFGQFSQYGTGTLDGVTYRGALTVGSYGTATVTGGITLLPYTGAGAGTINLTNIGSVLDFSSTETLHASHLNLGAALYGATLTAASSSGTNTLTLGAGQALSQVGAALTIGGYNGTISNLGSLGFTEAGGTLTLVGNITNSGTIAVSNGESLVLATNSLVNTGVISVTNGLLAIGNGTTAQLAAITLVNSDLAVTGTLTSTGSTLSVGAGTSIPVLKLQGTYLGGTIHDAGGGVQFTGPYAVLNGVTYQGALAINRPLSALSVVNGLTLTNASGASPGSLSLTGAGSALIWNSTQALDNATLTIGNAGLTYEGHTVSAPAIAAAAVTLGAHLTVQQSGAYADIGGRYYTGETNPLYTAGGAVQSAATINAGLSGGNFMLEGASFSTTGTIAISNGDTVTAGAAATTNAGLISIGAGSALDLDLYNYFADSSLADESFTNAGTILMSGGSLTELTDGGSFPAVGVLDAAGGHIKGFGVINAPLLDNGVVEASGGTLTLDQAVSGAGTLQIDAGATLNLAAVSNGVTAAFFGANALLGLSPPSFLGAIRNFAVSDHIDLASTSASAASFSGSSIVVTLTGGGTLTLATTSALAGSISVAAGTHGDTMLTYAATSAHSPKIPLTPVPDTASYAASALAAGISANTQDWVPPLHF